MKQFLFQRVSPQNYYYISRIANYVEHFEESKDDWRLVAVVDSKLVGALWVRIMNNYGHIDDETPSLAISLYKEYRGIGAPMIKEIFALLKSHGYNCSEDRLCSKSVSKGWF